MNAAALRGKVFSQQVVSIVMPIASKMNKPIVWFIATLTAIIGIYGFAREPLGFFNYLGWIIKGEIPSDSMPLWVTIGTFFIYLIIFLRPISSYGLFKLTLWGKYLAIGIFSIDFFIRLAGFINTITYYDRHPEMLKLYEEIKNLSKQMLKMAW